MSRTDAHRPYGVVLADEPSLRLEFHRHESGECTLPDDPSEGGSWRGCHFMLHWSAPSTCGCNLCTGRFSRRLAIKATRVRARALERAATRGACAEELDALEGRLLARSRKW